MSACAHGNDQPWPFPVREGAPKCLCCGWPLGTERPFCEECDSFVTSKRFLDQILNDTNARAGATPAQEDADA